MYKEAKEMRFREWFKMFRLQLRAFGFDALRLFIELNKDQDEPKKKRKRKKKTE